MSVSQTLAHSLFGLLDGRKRAAIARMPPKKRKVAAKAREDRRRETRAAAEPQYEPEIEHEQSSEAAESEDESPEEKDRRIDAEIEALRVKYGLHDDERSPCAPGQAVETGTAIDRHLAAIQGLEEASVALWRTLEQAAPEADLLFDAQCFAHRLRKRARMRASGSPAVPSRSYFDLLSK